MIRTPTKISVPKTSRPLTPEHIGLLKMLAGIAVADYLREIAAGEAVDERIEEDAHARR